MRRCSWRAIGLAPIVLALCVAAADCPDAEEQPLDIAPFKPSWQVGRPWPVYTDNGQTVTRLVTSDETEHRSALIHADD